MNSSSWYRHACPFQLTPHPPRPVPGRNASHCRIGKATSRWWLRKVIASRVTSCIIPLRIEYFSSSWIAGAWKSGTLWRPWPRSRATTLRPEAASSLARMEPANPTPMTTTSTSFNFCGTGLFPFRAGHHRVVARAIGDAQRFSMKFHTMLINQVVVICICTGESDHLPSDFVLIAAINRIGEESFFRVLQQEVEECVRRHAVEVNISFFESRKICVFFLGRQLIEGLCLRGEVRIDRENGSAEELRGRVLELISLHGSALSEWSVTIQHFATTPRSGHLKVDVIHDIRFRGARPAFVWRNQAIYDRQQKSPFRFVQKTMCFLGTEIPEQGGSFSCQRRS